MNLTNVLGLPDAFVAAVKADPYTGGGDISITKLIDAPQKRVLGKKYKDLIVEDASERVWSLMGQAVHTVLERANTTALVEERLYMEVDGWSVSGQFDRVHLGDGLMQDWKVTTVYKAKGDVSWERQLNCLRALAIHNGYQVDKLQIIAILRDWQRSASLRDPTGYPQNNVAVIDVPVWDLDQTHAYIQERVKMHQAAEQGLYLPCSDEERWYAGTTYALMKEGGKRATKTSITKEELGEPKKGYFIEERKGGYRRCENYCEVSEFCPQYQDDLNKEKEKNVDVS